MADDKQGVAASVEREAKQLTPEQRGPGAARAVDKQFQVLPVLVPGAYPANEGMLKRVQESFTYHAPRPGQPERYTALRLMAKDLAHAILLCTPPSREQALALTKLEEAIMWANKGIALEPEGR